MLLNHPANRRAIAGFFTNHAALRSIIERRLPAFAIPLQHHRGWLNRDHFDSRLRRAFRHRHHDAIDREDHFLAIHVGEAEQLDGLFEVPVGFVRSAPLGSEEQVFAIRVGGFVSGRLWLFRGLSFRFSSFVGRNRFRLRLRGLLCFRLRSRGRSRSFDGVCRRLIGRASSTDCHTDEKGEQSTG